MSNRWLVWGLVLVAGIAVLTYRMGVYATPSKPAGKLRAVFVTGGSDPYWKSTIAGAEAAAKELDIQLRVESPDSNENLEQQMAILSRIDTAEVDGVAISPLDADRQTPMLNQLAQSSSVVTFDSDAPLSMRSYYVGTSNYGAGNLCGELIAEALPEGGKIAVVLANLTKNNNIERREGLEATLGLDNSDETHPVTDATFEVVGYLLDGGDDEECRRLVRQALAEHTDLAAIVGMNGRHGPLLLEVLRDEEKLGSVKLVTFDYADEVLAGIEAGEIYATVAQDPYIYGYEAVRLIKKVHDGKHSAAPPILGGGSVFFDAKPVRQDNLTEFRDQLKKQTGKVAAVAVEQP